MQSTLDWTIVNASASNMHPACFAPVNVRRHAVAHAPAHTHTPGDTFATTVAHTFALRMKPVPVTLRLLKAAGAERMHLLVRWR